VMLVLYYDPPGVKWRPNKESLLEIEKEKLKD
jgi:hypothetical protein